MKSALINKTRRPVPTPTRHRQVRSLPGSDQKSEARSAAGKCVLLSDGRILTFKEARQALLERYWAS